MHLHDCADTHACARVPFLRALCVLGSEGEVTYKQNKQGNQRPSLAVVLLVVP